MKKNKSKSYKRYKKLYPDAKFECLNREYDFKELFKEVKNENEK